LAEASNSSGKVKKGYIKVNIFADSGSVDTSQKVVVKKNFTSKHILISTRKSASGWIKG